MHNGATHFKIIVYHRGHHWKGIQILFTISMTLSVTSFQCLAFFKVTKCFCNFIIIKRLIPLLFLSHFFLQNFYFVFLFSVALCRLLLELKESALFSRVEKVSSVSNYVFTLAKYVGKYVSNIRNIFTPALHTLATLLFMFVLCDISNVFANKVCQCKWTLIPMVFLLPLG